VAVSRRSLLFGALTFAAVAALCEALASAALPVLATRLRFPEPRLYTADVSAEQLAGRFDSELGWVEHYSTPFGERPRGVDRGRPLVAAFGDSFTHGDEVEDGETWGEALAQSLGGDVFNFGVGGYGMDQTLLRFERDQSRRQTSIVLFAFISGDLNRCDERYWQFHNPGSRFPFTKPRLLARDGALELMPNPVSSPEELSAGLRDVTFIERLAREDASYNPYDLPPIRRPYLLLFTRPSVWRAAFRSIAPRGPWANPDALHLAELILQRFARVARERGALPVIVALPLHNEMVRYIEGGKEARVSVETRAICERNHFDCIAPLLAEHAGPMGRRWGYFVRGRDGGHYSALGNQWIADAIAKRLREIAPDLLAGGAR
jgi:hypothetical protein